MTIGVYGYCKCAANKWKDLFIEYDFAQDRGIITTAGGRLL